MCLIYFYGLGKRDVRYIKHKLTYQTLMLKSWKRTILALSTRLKTKALDCNFTERDNMILDRIVSGCTSENFARDSLIRGTS